MVARQASHRHEVVIARSREDLDGAFRVRHQVFVEEIGTPSGATATADLEMQEVDAYATHFVARHEGNVIGTVRLQEPTPALVDPKRPIFGMLGEQHYDYAPLQRDGIRFVEMARSSVLRAYRDPRVIADLWKAAVLFSRRRGRDHFIAIASVGATDSLRDARIVHTMLARRGALHPRFQLCARATGSGPDREAYPLFSDAQRAAPETAPVPALFALFRRFGLRTCGEPVFLPEIGRVGLAMLAGPDTFPPATLQFFDTPDRAIRLD